MHLDLNQVVLILVMRGLNWQLRRQEEETRDKFDTLSRLMIFSRPLFVRS